jgi:hypothetical protein
MAATIRRVERLTTQDVKEAIRASTPIIATGMMKSWKASSRWSFDFFKQQYGSDTVKLSDGRFHALAELPLSHCIDFILSLDLRDTYKHLGATPYIQDWVVLDVHPELREDVELPPWFRNWERVFVETFRPRLDYHDTVVLAGPAGATTYVHRDRHHTHAWLAQIVGRKKWTMFPPDQYELLYKEPSEPGAQAYVNITSPDLQCFPRFNEATPIEFVLHPGELLFVPGGWLHQVTSLDPSISLSGNYVDGSNIGAFLKDALAEKMENRRAARKRPPQRLMQEFTTLAGNIDGGRFDASNGRLNLTGNWSDCDLRLSGNQDGLSWTLANYRHGRSYTSFFVDRRTDLSELDVDTRGHAAARELLALSPRGEFRFIAGLTRANVSLFGEVVELAALHENVLGALKRLTESCRPVDGQARASAPDAMAGEYTRN